MATVRENLAVSAAAISTARRRCAACRALSPARRATRCNQGATESRTQSVPPFLARIRNVAWNASSASCSFRTIARQVRKTSGPCRSTSAAKASSE